MIDVLPDQQLPLARGGSYVEGLWIYVGSANRVRAGGVAGSLKLVTSGVEPRAVVHPEVELEPGIPSSSRAGSCPYPATPG